MKKSKSKSQIISAPINEETLFKQVSKIIESRKKKAMANANREVVLMYWEIGRYINSIILEFKRAEYGKKIIATLSQQLVIRYGNTFELRNLRRMLQFAEIFPDIKIVSPLATQLSWSHFIELLSIGNFEARMYYAQDVISRGISTKELRRQISRKAFERKEIANSALTEKSKIPFNVFKDPYLLDILGLKENYLEADLEKAILTELEKFLLEFGQSLTFVRRQMRMVMNGEDHILDLLFYSRKLRRLVAIELKLEKFRPAFKGQMEFYIKWLNRYERQEGENEPIGLILCPVANRGTLELMEMDKSGIAVAEFWTTMPPKAEFERRINDIMREAKERLERRKSLSKTKIKKQIEYFYESKDDD